MKIRQTLRSSHRKTMPLVHSFAVMGMENVLRLPLTRC